MKDIKRMEWPDYRLNDRHGRWGKKKKVYKVMTDSGLVARPVLLWDAVFNNVSSALKTHVGLPNRIHPMVYANMGRIEWRLVVVFVAQLCPTLCDSMGCSPPLLCPRDSPGKNTGVGSHSLLQGIFLTQGLNPGLLHRRQILYHLSYNLLLSGS